MGADSGAGRSAVGHEALTAELARLRPDKVRAELANGEKQDVAVPATRKRWARVVETLETLPWVRVEFLDKKGAMLGAVEAEEELAVVEEEKASSREHKLLGLLVKAQDMALHRHERSLGMLLDGYRVMLESVLGRVVTLEKSYGDVLKLAHDSIVATAVAKSDGEGMNDADRAMMQMLMSRLGVPLQLKPKANGAAKPAAPDGGVK